jgi:hypothetical protein
MLTSDALREIVQYVNVPEYKAIIATCTFWYKTVKNADYEQSRINIISSLVLRHPSLEWNWELIGEHLTHEIIDAHIDTIDISALSSNPRLRRGFILKHWSHFDSQIRKNRAVTLDMIKYLSHTYDISIFQKNPNLDEDFIREHIHNRSRLEFHPNVPMDLVRVNNRWGSDLSSNVNLDEDFIRENWDDAFDLDELSKNRALTLKLIREYWDEYFADNNYELCDNPNITREFLQEYDSQIVWGNMVTNPVVTLEMVRDLVTKGKVTPKYASFNPNINDAFVREFANCDLYWHVIFKNNRCSLITAEENLWRVKDTYYDPLTIEHGYAF